MRVPGAGRFGQSCTVKHDHQALLFGALPAVRALEGATRQLITRLSIAVSLALLMVLQLRLWAGDGSIAALWELERALDAQRAENAVLEKRNAALAAEVQDLKSGIAVVEARARSELGMIGPGETFFLVVDPKR